MSRTRLVLMVLASMATSAVLVQTPATASPVPPCGNGNYQEDWVMYGQPRWGQVHTETIDNSLSDSPKDTTFQVTQTQRFGVVATSEVSFGLSAEVTAGGDIKVLDAAAKLTDHIDAKFTLSIEKTAQTDFVATFHFTVPKNSVVIYKRGIAVQTLRELVTITSPDCVVTQSTTYLNVGTEMTLFSDNVTALVPPTDATRSSLGLIGKLTAILPGCGLASTQFTLCQPGQLEEDHVIQWGLPGGGGGGSSGGPKAEPALAYDQQDGHMKIYRWASDGDSFNRTADYQSGSFSLSNVGDRVAVGDVDGDGHDDIVMAYQNGDGTFGFHVFTNGKSWAGIWYTSGPYSLAPVAGRLVVDDFNGDGKAEPALVRDDGDGTMTIWRWRSTGTSFVRDTDYHSGSFSLTNVGNRVASGDVDGDGKADIVMAYQNSDNTFDFHVFNAGSSWAGKWYHSGAFNLSSVAGRLVVADFTGDGKAEPALARDNGTTMTIYRWQSTGTSFTRATDYQSGSFDLGNVGDRVASGDVNGDGKADIVMAYQNSYNTFDFHVFNAGSSWAGKWYHSGPYNLTNVQGRMVVGRFS
jgi:hypothetical protein